MTRVPNPIGRRQYPGMNEFETRILRGYLRETAEPGNLQLHTNVRMSDGVQKPHYPDEFRRMAEELSALRADAIVTKGDRTELVEIKPRIRSTGVGQLNLYKLVQGGDMDVPPDAHLVLLGSRIHDDVVDPLRQLGIIVHVIPDSQLPVY